MTIADSMHPPAAFDLRNPEDLREFAANLYTAADHMEGPPSMRGRTRPGETQRRVVAQIRDHLKHHPLNQNEFAIHAGYGPDEFSGFMTCRRHLDLEDVTRIAQALELEPIDLFREGGDAA